MSTLLRDAKKYCLVLALIGSVSHVFAADNVVAVKAALTTKFSQLSGVQIDDVRETPIADIYSVHLPDGQQIYTTADGNHFFTGDLMQVTGKKIVNLTESERGAARVKALSMIKPKDTIVFPAAGAKKTSIYVFTDVDCGYCVKLHSQMKAYNQLGIEVRYLAYPRAGVGSGAYRKMVSAWCSNDRQTALTKLKQGESIPENSCKENPVAAQYKLGQQVGVNGTPAIITADGQMIPGYLPPDKLAQELGI